MSKKRMGCRIFFKSSVVLKNDSLRYILKAIRCEKFICTECGHIDHADLQAARNIKAIMYTTVRFSNQKN